MSVEDKSSYRLLGGSTDMYVPHKYSRVRSYCMGRNTDIKAIEFIA